MKKRLPIIVMSVLAIVIIAYFPAKNILGKMDFMTGWGKVLSDETKRKTDIAGDYSNAKYKSSVKGINSNSIVSGKDIYEAGSDILITNQEIEIAKSFYTLQGQSEKNAEKLAVQYIEEYNAMYVEAINNGFDVTEKEIDDYISDLKEMAKSAANSNDVENVIAQFDSEDEYWEYQKFVCQKQLPIQKYVETLEKEYLNETGKDADDEETIVLWNEELDKIKESAASKQKYKKIDDLNEIDIKFNAKK